MIFVTGDMHSDFARLQMEEKNWKAGDVVIVCGDFGFLFRDDKEEHIILDEIARKDYILCFVDGNHENFDALKKLPVKNWNGGKVHFLRDNIIHMMRGQMYTIDGKKFFTFGGAYSVDRATRIRNLSWWEREIPNIEDYRESGRNLKAAGMQADYVITHTAPQSVIRQLGFLTKRGYAPDAHDAELTGHLEWIAMDCRYKKWFFGHWHEDMELPGNFRALYFDVVPIG